MQCPPGSQEGVDTLASLEVSLQHLVAVCALAGAGAPAPQLCQFSETKTGRAWDFKQHRLLSPEWAGSAYFWAPGPGLESVVTCEWTCLSGHPPGGPGRIRVSRPSVESSSLPCRMECLCHTQPVSRGTLFLRWLSDPYLPSFLGYSR